MKKGYKYEGMNERQIEVLNKYTQYKSATNIQKRMGSLIKDESDLDNWIYNGYIDTGRLGNEHCSMGHSLRYVHFAKNTQTGQTIKFGIKCISDFFDITPDKLKMIKDGFIQINYLVDDIIRKFNEGYDFERIVNRLNSLKEKPVHYKAIQLLLDVKLPLPYEYEKEINTLWSKQCSQQEVNTFLENNPQYIPAIVTAKMIIDDEQFKNKHFNLYVRIHDMIKFLETNHTLSDNQLKLLNKIIMMDFTDIDHKIDMLKKVPSGKFIRRGKYQEYEVFYSLVDSYNNWGLSEKQIKLLDTMYNRYLKLINEVLEDELDELNEA